MLGALALLVAAASWSPPQAVPAETVRELELLGRLEFAVPRDAKPFHLGRWFVDPSGRVCISDSDTAAIHVFDSAGKWLFTCTPDVGDLSHKFYWWFQLTEQGHLLAGTMERLVEFDANGRRVACSALPKEPLRFLHLPRDEGRWELTPRELTFVSPDLARRVVREPKAERRSFRSASMAPDGALVVFEGGEGSLRVPTEFQPALHAFSGAGNHLWTLDLPYEGSVSDLTFDDRGVTLLADVGAPAMCAVGSLGPWEVWSVSRDGAQVARARLPRWVFERRQVSPSPDGNELWVLGTTEPALYRFARP